MATLTATDALVEELMRTEGKAEIIGGKVVKQMPTGRFPGRAALKIVASLMAYEGNLDNGVAFGDSVGFLCDLPNRRSFAPDASFYVGPGEEEDMGFLPEPPVFAVEVRSENDYGRSAERAIAQKIKDYFDAGTQVVWDVDLQHEPAIAKFTAPDADNPQFFRRGEVADAGDAVPNWTFNVDAMFARARSN